MLSGLILASMSFAPGFGPDAAAQSIRRGQSAVTYDGERPVHPGYPRLFDLYGRIDRLTNDEAVIGDSLYRIAPAAAYHTPNQRHALPSMLQAGDVVGCLTDSDGKIKSIWLITGSKR